MSKRMEALFTRFWRWRRKHCRRRPHYSLVSAAAPLEALESRHLLAVADLVPSIQGTVFLDSNGNGMVDAGEEIEGAVVQLYVDDGDGVFEPDTDDIRIEPDQTTDANGLYCFDTVDGFSDYFIFQPQQDVNGLMLEAQVSGAISPGAPNLVIDDFRTNQEVEANPPAPSSDGSTLAFPDESEVLGAERDLFASLVSGIGEVQLVVNPFGLNEVLQFNTSSGVQGSAIVTWDGQDADANPIPSMGLGGLDLTDGGVNSGFIMVIGIDTAGAGDVLTLSLFQGDASNVSTATVDIPVTDGTATAFAFVPFSDFTGPVSPSNVDAIQMSLGMESVPSADGEVSFVAVAGPKIFDIANLGGADLAISKSNQTTTLVPGADASYEIVVQNLGPENVQGAIVQDTFPGELSNVSYTSTVSGIASGNTPAGSGNINDTLNLDVGSSVTYVVSADVDPDATGTIVNTATVIAPNDTTDPNPANNTDTETDTLTPQVDLQIEKTNNLDDVSPGETVDYTITVINAGPSSATGATVQDTFPAELLNVSYTSSTSGGLVTGNTPTGSGNIDDTVNMAPGSQIVYLVSGTLDDTSADLVSNTATVTAPDGTEELNPNNNSSSQTDPIVRRVDLAISKSNSTTNVTPGETLTYQIVAQNLGPSTATGAMITDAFPASLLNVGYTSSATGGATGNTSGNGNIADTVDMPPGSTITYDVTATIASSATGEIVNTGTITAPDDLVEDNTANNTASETDTVQATVDLAVTKTDNVSQVEPNDVLTYVIAVSNDGPSDATGATLVDPFPSELTNISYTSTSQGGATGNTPAGTGNLNETLNLPAGSSITYIVSATVDPSATDNVSNTVTVAAPAGVVDSDPSNNSATDVDQLRPGVDLAISKTNNVDIVFAGGETTYTIVVSNAGPNSVTGATVIDNFPAEITSVSYTSVASGGASGNSNGTGNINDTVNMPVGSSITYTVVAQIDSQATGQLSNQAQVVVPNSVSDLNPANNTSTDTDVLDQALAEISGFVYVDINDDGIRGPFEPPISDVEILLRRDGSEIANTLTDDDGFYLFPNLEADEYDVIQIQPEDYENGKLTVGGGIGEVSGTNRFTVPLQPGDQATELNFGERPVQRSKRSLLASNFRN